MKLQWTAMIPIGIGLVALLALAPEFLIRQPTTYYVDNSCPSDGNGLAPTCAASGGASGAFNVLTSAPGIGGNSCSAGDRVEIKPGSGPYISTANGSDTSENGGFHISCGGSSGNPVIFTAHDPQNPPTIANCALASTTYAACDNPTITKGTNVQYITLSHLKIFGGVWLYGPVTTNEARLSRGITLTHNECYQGWGEVDDGNWSCFFLSNLYGVQFDHNYAHDIDITAGGGTQTSMSCLKIYTAVHSIYEFSTCDHVPFTGTNQAGGHDDKQDSQFNTHRFNRISRVNTCFRFQNQTGTGLPYQGVNSTGTKVYNNVCSVNGAFLARQGVRLEAGGIDDIEIYNNTFDGPMGNDGAILDQGTVSGFRFYNNVISDAVAPMLFLTSTTIALMDYNIWDSGTPGSDFRLGASTYANLAALVAGTAFEDHGVAVTNFGFTNEAELDYTPTAGSMMLNAGRVGGTSGGATINAGAYTDTVTCVGHTCGGSSSPTPRFRVRSGR